jgi:hypothetical protein
MPGCLTRNDCQASEVCVNPMAGVVCPRNDPACACLPECDPFGPSALSCAAGRVCRWVDNTTNNLGACIPDPGGGTQGQPCVANFDGMGRQIGDTCNAGLNTSCAGATPTAPQGICSRTCRFDAQMDYCPLVSPGTACYQARPDGIGRCLIVPSHQDISGMCSTPLDCQGNVCIQEFMGYCSASCDPAGAHACPRGSECFGFGQDNFYCLKRCSMDNDCMGANVCQLTSFGFSVCTPRCDALGGACPGTSCQPDGYCR